MKAHITVVVGLVPQAVNFGEVKVGEPVTRTLELSGSQSDGVQLTVEDISDEAIQATVRSEGGKSFVDVTLTPDRPRQLKARLSVTTSHDSVPKLHARVHGRVVGNLRVSPHSVSIQELDGEPKTGVVVVTSDKAGFEISGVSDPQDKVDVTFSEVEGRWRIEVTPKVSGEGARSFRTHLKLTTNDDLQPTLEVPVVARATASRRRPDRGPIIRSQATPKPRSLADDEPAKK